MRVPACVAFACVCVRACVIICQWLLSIRTCCGSVSVCVKERNWVKGNQSKAPILRCEAERQRESETERDNDGRRERAEYILVTPRFVSFTFRIIREVLLDKQACYHVPVSCSWVPQLLQTDWLISCQSLLMVFHCYFT